MEYFNIEKDIEDFLDNKIAVNCQTEEDAKEFLNFLASKYQMRWRSSEAILTNHTNWDDCKNTTCYNIDRTCYGMKKGLVYGSIDYYKQTNYKVLVYKSTESKTDIKLEVEQKTNLNIKSSNKRKIFIIEEN